MLPPKMLKMQRYIVVTLLVGLAGCTAEKKAPPFDGLLQAAVADKKVPGAVAMVATGEGVVYEGAANLSKEPIFAIASMTKPVTSVAVMQLVEAGKAKLDEPASVYVPELGKMCAVVMTQMSPGLDPGPERLFQDFDRAVYAWLQ